MSRRIFLLEGVDCSGKSSAAARLAKHLRSEGRRVVTFHHGPHLQVKKGLARLYVESALPALLGHADVILDRCWLSELPYGVSYRGTDRLGTAQRRMLERIFMRGETVVIYCDPGWARVSEAYLARKGEEYVDSLQQLEVIYNLYRTELQHTSLPVLRYDYTVNDVVEQVKALETLRPALATEAHVHPETAGSARAQVLIVGEGYAKLTDADPLYQKPFCAFSGAGCSLWLTEHLEEYGISERHLGWVNADQLDVTSLSQFQRVTHVVALGAIAGARCREVLAGESSPALHELPHPQAWKRFHHHEPYALGPLLKELLT